MKAQHISETSGSIHPTQRHIRDELNLHVSGYQTVVLLGFYTMLFSGLAGTFRRTPFVLRFRTERVGTFFRNVVTN